MRQLLRRPRGRGQGHGQGPHGAPQQGISRDILANTDSIYASLAVDGAIEAVARLALVGNLGGIYSVATREAFRSRAQEYF